MIEPTHDMIAAAWRAFRRDKTGRLGPGPGFVEAIKAALNAMPQGDELVAFKRMCRDQYDAFCAMRNDINELIGNMASQESTLIYGPEMPSECAAVVTAVAEYVNKHKEHQA